MAAPEELPWEEVEVDVLWGKIRGKRVDLKGGGRQVVCLHGWVDNANTFDLLIPHLPAGLTFLSLDLPGHGLSDHLPLGCHYDIYTYVRSVHKVLAQLGWTKVVFISHSLGCLVALYMAVLYPEYVDVMVNIDFVSIENAPVDFVEDQRKALDHLADAERKRFTDPPVYTRDALLEKMVEGRRHGRGLNHYPIDGRIAEILFPRAAKLCPGRQGYIWRHDIKLKARFTKTIGYANWLRMVDVVSCPVLLVRATNGVSETLSDNKLREIVSTYRANGGSMDFVEIEDKHHVHLTSPVKVAEVITDFFRKINIGTLSQELELKARL
ncbi:serine hydrolase-like protein [Oratosquilla oratoria]|uniref:serine hydrolase-like protein n=1 Tax=Oratosquilla oratoria TaxID=337810 RepID=UPI003F76B034